MIETRITLGGLSSVVVGDQTAPLVLVFLHGRMMQAAELAPFAHSLALPASCVFPDAPMVAQPQGFSWWSSDSEARARAIAEGPLDLYALDPPGRGTARAQLAALCGEAARGKSLVLVGFSQGGMLAMDYALHCAVPDALVLLSSSRIAFNDWRPRLSRLRGLPMLIAHGSDDAELDISAGERLRDAALSGGADVTWLPFAGGHEIPLPVWRALRNFVLPLHTSANAHD